VAKEFDRKDRRTTTAPATATATPTGLMARFLLIAGSVIFSLGVLEAGMRLVRSGPEALVHWPNYARERMGSPEQGGGPCVHVYDQTLGWTSPGGCRSPAYNSDAGGFRRMPDPSPGQPPLALPPILATGSSFTKGEEVSDGESWPAYLQALTGRKVLNAGVSGYSFDQTVLATEAVARLAKPLVVVVSFTPDDIRRSELAVSWSRAKPYFGIVGDRLELRNVPVPGGPQAPVALPVAARLLGWSALADEIAKRLGIFRGWYFDEVQAVPPGSGAAIACLLMPRLAALGVPVVLMAQYGRGYWRGYADREASVAPIQRKVLGCAAAAGLMVFDLADPLKAAVDSRGPDALYRTDHHAAEGNRLVAELLMRELVRRGLLPRAGERSHIPLPQRLERLD
jgi:hypothetical protein